MARIVSRLALIGVRRVTCVVGLCLGLSAAGQMRKDDFVEALPVFTSGLHSNKHAVYEHEKFQAWVDSKGFLWVQPLDGGKPVGQAFSCFSVEPAYPAKDTVWPRPMERFQEAASPTVIPRHGGKLRLKGRLEGDIPFVVEYVFEANRLRARGGCQDKPTTKPPTIFRLVSRFAPTHRFAADTPTDQIMAATQGMSLEARAVGAGSPAVYPFWQAIKTDRLYIPHAEMIVRGAFGPRVIVARPTGTEGALLGWVYEGRSLWQGFCILYRTQGKKINLSANEVTVLIE